MTDKQVKFFDRLLIILLCGSIGAGIGVGFVYLLKFLGLLR